MWCVQVREQMTYSSDDKDFEVLLPQNRTEPGNEIGPTDFVTDSV